MSLTSLFLRNWLKMLHPTLFSSIVKNSHDRYQCTNEKKSPKFSFGLFFFFFNGISRMNDNETNVLLSGAQKTSFKNPWQNFAHALTFSSAQNSLRSFGYNN